MVINYIYTCTRVETQHKPKDALHDNAVESQYFLRQRRLYPWQLSLRKPVMLQCHHLGQRASKHRRHIDGRLQRNTLQLMMPQTFSLKITPGVNDKTINYGNVISVTKAD